LSGQLVQSGKRMHRPACTDLQLQPSRLLPHPTTRNHNYTQLPKAQAEAVVPAASAITCRSQAIARLATIQQGSAVVVTPMTQPQLPAVAVRAPSSGRDSPPSALDSGAVVQQDLPTIMEGTAAATFNMWDAVDSTFLEDYDESGELHLPPPLWVSVVVLFCCIAQGFLGGGWRCPVGGKWKPLHFVARSRTILSSEPTNQPTNPQPPPQSAPVAAKVPVLVNPSTLADTTGHQTDAPPVPAARLTVNATGCVQVVDAPAAPTGSTQIAPPQPTTPVAPSTPAVRRVQSRLSRCSSTTSTTSTTSSTTSAPTLCSAPVKKASAAARAPTTTGTNERAPSAPTKTCPRTTKAPVTTTPKWSIKAVAATTPPKTTRAAPVTPTPPKPTCTAGGMAASKATKAPVTPTPAPKPTRSGGMTTTKATRAPVTPTKTRATVNPDHLHTSTRPPPPATPIRLPKAPATPFKPQDPSKPWALRVPRSARYSTPVAPGTPAPVSTSAATRPRRFATDEEAAAPAAVKAVLPLEHLIVRLVYSPPPTTSDAAAKNDATSAADSSDLARRAPTGECNIWTAAQAEAHKLPIREVSFRMTNGLDERLQQRYTGLEAVATPVVAAHNAVFGFGGSASLLDMVIAARTGGRARSIVELSALRSGGNADDSALASDVVAMLNNWASLASMFADPALANASTGNSTDVAECGEDAETWLTGSVKPSVVVGSKQQAAPAPAPAKLLALAPPPSPLALSPVFLSPRKHCGGDAPLAASAAAMRGSGSDSISDLDSADSETLEAVKVDAATVCKAPAAGREAAPEPASESAEETSSEVADAPSPASDELATPSFASASGFSSFSNGIENDISTEQLMTSSGGDDDDELLAPAQELPAYPMGSSGTTQPPTAATLKGCGDLRLLGWIAPEAESTEGVGCG